MSDQSEPTPRPYEAEPCYPPLGGTVTAGWPALLDALPSDGGTLAIEGPVIGHWAELTAGLGAALAGRGLRVEVVPAGNWLRPWPEIERLTSSARLRDDPDFDTLAAGALADLFDLDTAARRPAAVPAGTVRVVYGPGAALLPHDRLWYADLPKRYAEAAVTSGAAGPEGNLGRSVDAGPATTKRLFYVDWPLLDRHRDELAPRVDRWLDTQDPRQPSSVDGDTLRATLAALAERPFRTRPTFNTTSWGGHWAQRTLGMNTEARNTALGYELIAPESGILIGAPHGPRVEVPFQLAVALHPERILGAHAHRLFGTSFPIRFDYLDTVDGGNLSVHCHPRTDYMRTVFGWPYTQHETYYLMVGGERNQVFLGLREDADIDEFHQRAHDADAHGVPFEITRYVRTFPATPHQIFLIPGGTPHGSGAGNVVLEISATPYLYSLRFYDWLRQDAEGRQRPVHVEHAFRNLDTARRGDAVRTDLVPKPTELRAGDGWHEDVLGALREMFFEVRRVELAAGAVADDSTDDRFHVLNVVEGAGVLVVPESGPAHSLAYAETLVLPAAVGAYTVRPLGDGPARVVKALVR
jgi:hypothetical protein